MSFLCCEDAGVYTSICESFDVTFETDTGFAPVHIDLRRSPFRQMCLTVIAPLTFQVSNATVVTVTLTLYKGRSISQADIVKVTPNVIVSVPTGGMFASVTPALLHKVPPGEYTIQISASLTGEASIVTAYGLVNAGAVLSQLTL
jgi:hypothetical protein